MLNSNANPNSNSNANPIVNLNSAPKSNPNPLFIDKVMLLPHVTEVHFMDMAICHCLSLSLQYLAIDSQYKFQISVTLCHVYNTHTSVTH